MNTRLKKIRQELKMTQEIFGQSLGVTRDTYASYENGRVIPKDTFIQLLCSVYKINVNWLKAGIGEMLNMTKECVINDLVVSYNLDDVDTQLIKCFLNLEKSDRAVIKKYITDVVCSVTQAPTEEEQMKAEIAEELKLIEAELWAEKRAKAKSSDLDELLQA